MARAALTAYTPDSNGVQVTKTAVAADGHSFVYQGLTDEIVIDNGATAMVVTIPTPLTIDGLAVSDMAISVGSNETHVIGKLRREYYVQSDGSVYINYDDTTDGTVYILRGK